MKARLEAMPGGEVNKEHALEAVNDRGGPSLSKQEAARDAAIREENLNHYVWTKRDEEVAARGGVMDERKGPMFALSTESAKIRNKETLQKREDLEAAYVSTLASYDALGSEGKPRLKTRHRARLRRRQGRWLWRWHRALTPPPPPAAPASTSSRAPSPRTSPALAYIPNRCPRNWRTRSGWRTTTRRWCRRTPR